MDRDAELEKQVGRLTEALAEMRARLSLLEGTPSPPGAVMADAPRSRRDLLKLGGVAALGAVGAVALRSTPAAATTGNNFVLGNANLAENPTTLAADGGTPPDQVLAAEASSFSSATLAATNTPSGTDPFFGALQGLGGAGVFEGVDGWASGPSSFGVYGFTDSGTGVVGESATGVGLYARRSGRIRQDPRPAGLPNYAPTTPEQVRDAAGVLWINNPATGAWRRVNTVRMDAADGSGNPFKPYRALDTRGGAIRAAGSFDVVPIAGTGAGLSAIPPDAVGVIGNLTAVAYSGQGWLAVMPEGAAYDPAADPSSVNFITGQFAIANSFTCGLHNGQLQVYVGRSSSHFILDITAYVQ
jgi:hypothetical protein